MKIHFFYAHYRGNLYIIIMICIGLEGILIPKYLTNKDGN